MFDKEYGLKQGCVLSPTLFSVLMNDLVRMLRVNGVGVDLSSQIISSLLFADDIVLMAERDLQCLLDVTHKFASKWNLEFNHKKSKVLVVGKRVDKSKKWVLGDKLIEEANEYKYLGVFFSRSLKFTYHIESYLKDNFRKKLNYMTRILAEHGSFNRFNFGDSLWMYVIRPSIAHGCATWMPTADSSLSMIDSWQYQVGKLILCTKLNIPKCALLAEFGWEPINSFLDRQRVSYFARFAGLPDDRLCKIVFQELKFSRSTEWNYFSHMERLFQSIGLDHYIDGNVNKQTFNKFFGGHTFCKVNTDINEKRSLHLYRSLLVSNRRQTYLCNYEHFFVL